MRKKGMKKGIALILSALMVFGSVASAFSASGSSTAALTSGSFDFLRSETVKELTEGKQNTLRGSDSWYYSDAWFDGNAWEENERLAVLSLQLAMSTKGSTSGEWYENTEAFLEDLGFSRIRHYESAEDAKPEESWKLLIGTKNVRGADGKSKPLIVILPQSLGYTTEWAGNFYVGESYVHKGFETAAWDALLSLREYVAEYRDELGIERNESTLHGANVKYWIPGYSRGAAIANLLGVYITGIVSMENDYETLAALLDEYYMLMEGEGSAETSEAMDELVSEMQALYAEESKDIYVYTFGCPAVSEVTTAYWKTDEINEVSYYLTPLDNIYGNIFNYLSSTDIVALVPPSYFSSGITVDGDTETARTFGRYGTDIYTRAYEGEEAAQAERAILPYLEKMNPVLAEDFKERGMQSEFSETEIATEVSIFGESMTVDKLLAMVAASVSDPKLWEGYGSETSSGETGLDVILDALIYRLFEEISEKYKEDKDSILSSFERTNVLDTIDGIVSPVGGSELTQRDFLSERIWNGIRAGLLANVGGGSESEESAIPRKIYAESYQDLFITLTEFVSEGIDPETANRKTLEHFKADTYYPAGEELSLEGLAAYISNLKEAAEEDEEASALQAEIRGYLKNMVESVLCMYLYTVTDQRLSGTGEGVSRMLGYIDEAKSRADEAEGSAEDRFQALAGYIYYCYMLDEIYSFVDFTKGENAVDWDAVFDKLNSSEATVEEGLEYLEGICEKLSNTVSANRDSWEKDARGYSELSGHFLDLAAKNMTLLLEGMAPLLETEQNKELYAAFYEAFVKHDDGSYNNGAIYIAKLLSYAVFGLDESTVYGSGSGAQDSVADSEIWKKSLDNLATLYSNVHRIIYAHYPEVYLSWLMVNDPDDLYMKGIKKNSGSNSSKRSGGNSYVNTNTQTTPASAADTVNAGETAPARSAEEQALSAKAAERFDDVAAESWYAAAVEKAVEAGLLRGVSDDSFAPDSRATREQAMTVLARIAGEEAASTDEGFAWATANGISDGSEPKGLITREQFVTMLYRLLGEEELTGESAAFSDSSDISAWAAEAMSWALGKGILQGYDDGTLRPKAEITRAQLAAILTRIE